MTTSEHNLTPAGAEPRLIAEDGLAGTIATLIEGTIEGLGYQLVRVRFTNEAGRTLQIMAEKADGTMTVEGCAEISREISPLLDLKDPIPGNYNLEVSSPGLDRPLVRRVDFLRHQGFEARVELNAALGQQKRFRGLIGDVNENEVILEAKEGDLEGESNQYRLPFDRIKAAKMILSDELLAHAQALAKEVEDN